MHIFHQEGCYIIGYHVIIYIYTINIQKITNINTFSPINLFTTLLVTVLLLFFTITNINNPIFTINTITIINNIISIVIIINIILFVIVIRISTWFGIIYIYDNSVYINIWFWTLFWNYKKFFIKNFNIQKIFHLKFTEKIEFRKPMFQSRVNNIFFL